MELDDLKPALQQRMNELAKASSTPAVQQYLSTRSTSVLAKLSRSLRMELVLSILFAFVFGGCILYTAALYAKILCAIGLVLSILFATLFARLERAIRHHDAASAPTLAHLSSVLYLLETFVRLYSFFSMIMLPIIFLLGLSLGYAEVKDSDFASDFDWARSALVYGACFLLWSVLVIIFTKWYLRKLYGEHLADLRRLKADLENG